jgi:hypothetical protein
MIQHLELARANLARLRSTVPEVILIEPVPYSTISGTGLYRQFFDNVLWPDFIRAGRTAARRALRKANASIDGAQRPMRSARTRRRSYTSTSRRT